mgnify:CR=1 FL=1
MEENSRNNIFATWILWQFYQMPKFLLQVWSNYFMFAANYFSFILLLKTFFSPWKKYSWRYPKGFDLGEFFSTLISNFFSRILGAVMRVFLIIAGVFLQVFVAVFGSAVFLFWFFLPFIIIVILLFVLVY